MENTAYLEAIRREAQAISEVLVINPAAEVPPCPGWRVADLGVHLGAIHRWVAEMVRSGATERLDREQFVIDADDPALGTWYLESANVLLDTLANVPSSRPVWSWMPGSTAAFWTRRQAHETAVHRWDAQAAIDRLEPMDPALCSDGIDEMLNVFDAAHARATSKVLGTGESFHFHCTDVDGEWIVRFEGSGIDIRREHTKGDVAVRGLASDLLLFLWGRKSAAGLDVIGSAELFDRWFEFVPPL